MPGQAVPPAGHGRVQLRLRTGLAWRCCFRWLLKNLAVSFVLLFNPPQGLSQLGSFFWLTTFAVLVRTSYTFYNIPHLSLGAEMSGDYLQRSTLFAYSALVTTISITTSYGLITGYFFPTTDSFDPGFLNPDGYPRMSLMFAGVMVAAILLCVLGTRREIPFLRATQVRERVTLVAMFKELRAVFGDPSFRALFFGGIPAAMVAGVEGAFIPFMGVHFWGLRTEQLFYIAFVAPEIAREWAISPGSCRRDVAP